MATEAVQQFWNRVEKDAALRRKVSPLRDMDDSSAITGEVVRIAADAGFEFTADELEQATEAIRAEAQMEGELQNDQLERVVGGIIDDNSSWQKSMWSKTLSGEYRAPDDGGNGYLGTR